MIITAVIYISIIVAAIIYYYYHQGYCYYFHHIYYFDIRIKALLVFYFLLIIVFKFYSWTFRTVICFLNFLFLLVKPLQFFIRKTFIRKWASTLPLPPLPEKRKNFKKMIRKSPS